MSAPEKEGARVAALNELAAGTVHDVNNLLMLVIGCAEMALDDEALSPRSRQLMLEIVAVGERASLLTRRFLAMGKPSVRPASPTDVVAVLTAAESLLRRVAGERIELVIDAGTTPQWVRAEASQIEQILVNLASNARDAMPAGGVLRVAVHDVAGRPDGGESSEGAPRLARLVVTDTGGGIDQAVQGRIFDAFVTTKGEGKGSGLGLAVVRTTVDALGGSIEVTTGAGQGTTFAIDLPRAPAPAP